MDKANSLKHFPCTRHPEATVRKFDPRDDGAQVYCLECLKELDKTKTQHLINIEDYPTEYLKLQSKAKDISGALGPIPKDIEETLTKEKEIKEKLAAHIENEKKKVNQAYDALQNKFHDELQKNRAEGHKIYDAELTRFNENFEVLHDNIKVFKSGGEKLETIESLVGHINRVENSNDLVSFLTHLKNRTDTYKAVSSPNQEERTETVQTGLINICKNILDISHKKPVTTYDSSHLKHEELAKNWETSVPALQRDLDVHIMNKVPKLTLQKACIDSKILKETELDMLVSWLNGRKKFELLFRGSEHGMNATAFHEKCDGKGPTVVLIKNSTEERFGGYAEVSWGTYSENFFLYSEGSFLFSLDLKEKVECIDPMRSLYSNPGYGPCWGERDLKLQKSFLGEEIYYEGNYIFAYCESYMGTCYKEPSARRHFPALTNLFTVKEIEVYAVKG